MKNLMHKGSGMPSLIKAEADTIELKCDVAAIMIGAFLRKWGRMPVRDFKEKYGTVRVYCSFGWRNAHDLFYPGYAYYQFPEWLKKLDIHYGDKIMLYSGLSWLSFHYHTILYRLAYKRVLKTFPEIRENILCCADWKEFLEGL